jgi:hypothetical protein
MDTSAVCNQLVKPLLELTPDWTFVDIFDQQTSSRPPANRYFPMLGDTSLRM